MCACTCALRLFRPYMAMPYSTLQRCAALALNVRARLRATKIRDICARLHMLSVHMYGNICAYGIFACRARLAMCVCDKFVSRTETDMRTRRNGRIWPLKTQRLTINARRRNCLAHAKRSPRCGRWKIKYQNNNNKSTVLEKVLCVRTVRTRTKTTTENGFRLRPHEWRALYFV